MLLYFVLSENNSAATIVTPEWKLDSFEIRLFTYFGTAAKCQSIELKVKKSLDHWPITFDFAFLYN